MKQSVGGYITYYKNKTPMAEEQDWKNVTQRGLKAAHPDRPHSQIIQSPQKSQEVSLQRSVSQSSIDLSQSAMSWPLFPGLKKIQIKKQDHTIRNLLCMVAFFSLIILSIDLKSGIQKEWHKHELEAQHCYAQYTQNQCENPLQAIREKCKELHICYSTKTDHKIKVSSILASLVGQAVNNCANSAGLAGMIFLLSLICAILFFAYKSSKATMTLKKD